jgi:hypothetical protein
MNPKINPTQYALENLEHGMADAFDAAMYDIIDNGDRPDKRINAIIALHRAKFSVINAIHKITFSVE